jgi:hypothetical protein
VEDICGQCRLNISLLKDLREVFNLSGTRGVASLKVDILKQS